MYCLGYGVSTFERETGGVLDRPRRSVRGIPGPFEHGDYLNRVFLSLLRSLGQAGSRPKHIEIILREGSISDPAFNLPRYVDPIVQPVLDNLRTLLLDVNALFVPAYVDDVETACPNYLLTTFLSRLPELEHLRLNFRLYQEEQNSNLLLWLSKPVPTSTPRPTTATSLLESPKPLLFGKLRQLDIGMITVEPNILLAIIQKQRETLRSISLHKVCLLQSDQGVAARENLWAKFFGKLSKLDLKLTRMKMSLLSQNNKFMHSFLPVRFKDSKDPNSREWGGTDVQSCLRDFIANVEILWPQPDTESSHTDDSDPDGKSSSLKFNTSTTL